MIEIRAAAEADDDAIARVRRESWFAAYSEIIASEIIDRVTGDHGRAVAPPPWRRSVVAVASVSGEPAAVIGYAVFGPERVVPATALLPSPHPLAGGRPAPPVTADPDNALTAAGRSGLTGEVYALYLAPSWWSAGAGRALFGAALEALRAGGYREVVLWVLTGNARARRFYEKAGFAPDGATHNLPGLGNVEELRYVRPL